MRLAGAVAVSLLIHGLIISLQFGVPGIGLPALEMPWRERRAQAVDLNVVLVNPASSAAPPSVSAEPVAPPPPPAPIEAPRSGLRLVPLPKTAKASAPEKPASKRKKEKPAVAARPPRTRAKRETPVIALNEPRENSFNMPAPAVDEIPTPPEPETAAPPVALPVPDEVPPLDDPTEKERELAAQKLAEEEKAQRQHEAEEREARQQAETQAEQQRMETARRQEEEAAARELALALEAQRTEEAKRRTEEEKAVASAAAQAAQQEAQRLALEREERRKAEEAARREAATLALQKQQEETQRREREEAARSALELEEKQRAQREAMELQSRKQAEAAAEAARQQAAAREREKQAEELAARRKAEAEAASAARREREPELMLGDSPGAGERIDALPRNLTGGGIAGRALEQARRGDMQADASRNAPPSARQSDSNMDAPRRRSIFGSKDVDVGVMMYVESWRLKIERNGSIMFPRAAVERSRGDPVVTVAVRSDGSVEDVVIHRSSGRPELDEAVHRIVRVNARYSAFPPELARRFDVIEIRRVWNFEDRLRILEEVR